MENQNINPSPETIMKIGSGFWPSKILLTAVHFEVFTKLAKKKSMSARELKSELGLQCTDRHVYDFLDTLTGLGFLNREGLLDNAHYSNGTDTDVFLDKNKPSYIGGILEMMNERLFGFWDNLEEGLLTGQPQNEAKKGENIFEAIYSDPDKLKVFVHGMTGVQMGAFIAFAEKFDFSSYQTLTDAGGSAGMLSIMVAKHQLHISCVTFDLPPIEAIANETIQKFQLTDRVKTASGDFFTSSLPPADLVVMGNILHDWDEDSKIALIKKAYDALPAGGAFVVIENIIDDDRKHNVFGMMMSLNMLIETGTGFDYTFTDFNKWAKMAGFNSTNLLPLVGPTSAAIAYK
ncbi:methyltransferase [Algoriphagus sp. C2-6-M1]|uniref:methyltransferase n=1 Tax=Algoriphagus persicinus TaxID=3108754 RepID=UPI002B3E6413|nr:methyltransferase [Algoriphagus sp. C2-6-M1]MEB2780039.1 methyltransferase [Algoriphagus sp. C2-6-M1]